MAEWKPIDELFDYTKGTLQSSKCTPGKYAFITAAEEWKTHETFTHDCEALIFAMAASGSLGRTHYIKGKFISSDLCFILTPKKGLRLDLTFYHRLFNFLRIDIVKKTATGTSKLAINQTNFGAYKLPYFDYEHQLSFRNKIETIGSINEEFSEGVDFQLYMLAKLRQSVLQEAIEGKLTEEWRKQNSEFISGENSASKLLERIRDEKDRLVKDGKIRKDKDVLPVSKAEQLAETPKEWTWSRLGLCLDVRDGTHDTPAYVAAGIPLITSKNLCDGKIDFLNVKYISEADHRKISSRSGVDAGDILFAMIGTIGNPVVIIDTAKEFSIKNVALFKVFDRKSISVDFLYWYLLYGQKRMEENARGALQPFVSLGYLREFPVVVPPIAEQIVISERIKQIMTVLSELEKQAVQRKEHSELLMRSVLREAFAG